MQQSFILPQISNSEQVIMLHKMKKLLILFKKGKPDILFSKWEFTSLAKTTTQNIQATKATSKRGLGKEIENKIKQTERCNA